MDTYRISSTGNSINYLPQYIAEVQGFFEELDLEIETEIPNPWTKVLSDINSGNCQAVCGGIWVPNMYLGHNVKNYSAFAKISSRCPYKLVSREKQEPFKWKSLEEKTVLVPSDGGASAYIFLMGTLKKNNVNVEKVRFIHDFLDHMLVECFTNGFLGDYIFTNAVSADKIQDDEKGFVVSEMATEGGPVPWSVYYSTTEVSQDKRNLNGRFALGIQKGLEWLLKNGGEAVVPILKKKWPGNNIDTGVKTVNRFIKEGMWDTTIEIGKEEFDNYVNYQIDAGILDYPIQAKDIIDYDVLDYVNKNR